MKFSFSFPFVCLFLFYSKKNPFNCADLFSKIALFLGASKLNFDIKQFFCHFFFFVIINSESKNHTIPLNAPRQALLQTRYIFHMIQFECGCAFCKTLLRFYMYNKFFFIYIYSILQFFFISFLQCAANCIFQNKSISPSSQFMPNISSS